MHRDQKKRGQDVEKPGNLTVHVLIFENSDEVSAGKKLPRTEQDRCKPLKPVWKVRKLDEMEKGSETMAT